MFWRRGAVRKRRCARRYGWLEVSACELWRIRWIHRIPLGSPGGFLHHWDFVPIAG